MSVRLTLARTVHANFPSAWRAGVEHARDCSGMTMMLSGPSNSGKIAQEARRSVHCLSSARQPSRSTPERIAATIAASAMPVLELPPDKPSTSFRASV